MSVVEGAEAGDSGEYELALLEVRLSELAGEVREVHRRALSLDDRVARVVEGYDGLRISRASSALLMVALTGLAALGRRRERAERGRQATERELRTTHAPVDAKMIDMAGDGPVIKVLGPVSIAGARGDVGKSHVGQLTEIAAYIALHPGTTGEDLDNAIWPGEPLKRDSRAQACSRLRKWLGSDGDGKRCFPPMTNGRYGFTPAVRTDWDQFRALVPTDPGHVPTERLEAALGLVDGQPFTGATGRRPKYRWADQLKAEMIIAITEAATVVAARALEANQPARARTAAATGLQAEPGMEQLWRLLLEAERRAGNRAGLRTAVDQLKHQLADLGTDPEPETTALIKQVLPGRC